MITLSTYHLSPDGARASTEENRSRGTVNAEVALATLKAFAAVPALELAGLDPRIILTGPKGRIAVRNSGGKLLVVLLPEVLNTWEECTPGQTIARLMDDATPATEPAGQITAGGPATGARRAIPLRRYLNSGWALGGIATFALAMAWINFSPDTPAGVKIIRDSAKIRQLREQVDGRYGADEGPGRTILELRDGRFRSYQIGMPGAPSTVLAESNFRYGLRDGHAVVIVENGAVLELEPDGGLRFLDHAYPRILKNPT